MKKLTAIGHSSVRAELMEQLMTLGVVEISDQEAKLVEGEWKTLVKTDRNEGSVGRYDNWINRTTQSLEALEKYRTGKKPLFKTRAPITLDAFEECLKDRHRIEKNTEILVHQNNKLAELQAKQNKLEASRMSLKPWKDYRSEERRVGKDCR